MTPRLLVLAAAPLLATATAHAQAPGAMEPTGAPGMTEPQVTTNPCGMRYAQVNPMANRFAVGLSLGNMTVSSEDAPEGTETEFRGAELAIRYRLTRRWELMLAFAGGREYVEAADTEGDLATDSVTFGARFRFMPERKWNWFLTAGFGSTVIAHHESSKEERDALARPHAMFGIGIERRFRRFALQAELRGMSIGPREAMDVTQPVRPDGREPVPPATTTTASDELASGSFTVGASYYF
jgi:hypothetical protein